MLRTLWALGFVLFLAACGGGGDKAPTPRDIPERIEDVIQADPVFLGSTPIIISDGGSFELSEQECTPEFCELDDQETSLAALLGAEGFQPTGTRRGVTLGRGTLQHFEGEIRRYGGWLQHSAFAVHSGVLTDGEPGTEGYVEERIIHSYSVGGPSGTNPVTGNATWTGMMVGADVSLTATAGNFVQGNATLSADLTRANLDVTFSNIRDLTTNASHANITWADIPMADGAFDAGTIQGSFYGSDHGEVGGIFSRNNLQGAFGAKR